MTGSHVLVIGARGLLGSAMVRALDGRGATVHRAAAVPWSDPAAAAQAVLAAAAAVDSASGGDWTLVWAAGAGVVGATPQVLEVEVATLRALVDAFGAPGGPRPRLAFFASSAGAVYGGSTPPPFSEASVPRPLGAYGEAKLRAEAEVARLAPGTRVLVGRISNLYGPGQDLSKNQGLITRLCLSHLDRQPIGIYVSLDTIRDYLFVDDCAELVCDGLDRLRAATDAEAGHAVVKVLASQRPASIALLLGECRRVFGRKVLVRLASSDLAGQQSRDLRLTSSVWPELDLRPTTPLVHGIHVTLEGLRHQIGTGSAAAGR